MYHFIFNFFFFFFNINRRCYQLAFFLYFCFRRISYGNVTHLNISVTVGEDNRAILKVALDKSDSVYFGCDAGCLNPPVSLSQSYASIPVKLTKPLTAILYITSDYQHMQDLRNALHVHAIDDGWYIYTYINHFFSIIPFNSFSNYTFISYLKRISRVNPQRNLIHFSFVSLTKSFSFKRIRSISKKDIDVWYDY